MKSGSSIHIAYWGLHAIGLFVIVIKTQPALEFDTTI